MHRTDPDLQRLIKGNTLAESIFKAIKLISGCTLEDLHHLFAAFGEDKVSSIVEQFIQRDIIFQMWDEYYVRVDTFPAALHSRALQA